MTRGLIFDLKRFAMHDGPGIRLTVFFKGCPLRCQWCHNPESIYPQSQTVQKEYKSGNGTSVWMEEQIGQFYTVSELVKEIEKEQVFFDESGGGVTFSGGEPLLQIEFLQGILEQCKKLDIHTAIDTSGFAPFSAFELIHEKVDLFLYDIKLLNDDEHKTFTGVSNRLILDNLKQLTELHNNIVIRVPIIPLVTDTKANMEALVELIKNLKSIRSISLLPFHNIASAKYRRFGLENRFKGVPSLTNEALQSYKTFFSTEGFEVTIGG